MCKRPKNANTRGRGRNTRTAGMRRVNMIQRDADQSGSSEWDDDNVVLNVNGTGTPPFMMKGKLNNTPFNKMINSGSSITSFTRDEVRRILKSDLPRGPLQDHCPGERNMWITTEKHSIYFDSSKSTSKWGRSWYEMRG